MTSETVVVELSRGEAKALIANTEYAQANWEVPTGVPDSCALGKLRDALASDSQGAVEEGVCPECDHDIRPGSSHARTCSRHPVNQPHSHNQPEQGRDEDWRPVYLTRRTPISDPDNYTVWGPADLPETAPHPIDGESQRYLPAPTQPSLSEEDRGHLRLLADDLLRRAAKGEGEAFGSAARLIEKVIASPPEPQAQEGEKHPGEISWCHIHRVAKEGRGCEQCLEDTGGYCTHIYVPAESATRIAELEHRANDLQARLENAEAKVRLLQERSGPKAVEAVLNELAAEFDRRAVGEDELRNKALAVKDVTSAAVHAVARDAHLQAAQLLREKQAALKGGGG